MSQGIRYAKSHEWIIVADNVATIGISEFAVEQLADLVNLELPDVGDSLDAEESFGEVESVKTVSDLYMPIGGKVTAVNDAVAENLELLSDSPLEDGWLIKIEVSDLAELEKLMSEEEYTAMITEDGNDDDDDDDLDLDDLLDDDDDFDD